MVLAMFGVGNFLPPSGKHKRWGALVQCPVTVLAAPDAKYMLPNNVNVNVTRA